MAPGTTGLASPEAMAGLRGCVHCGICLPQCPTYQVLGEEMDSPRGRLYLMRAVAEGRLDRTETYMHHLDLCLGCRACETACPAGVPFGSLLETARVDIARQGRRRLLVSLLFAVLPYPERMASMLGLAGLWRRAGLQRLARSTGMLARFPRLAAMDALLGDIPAADPLPELIPARGTRRGRVGLLTGCVQRHLYPHVNRDTASLLSLAGYDVVIPRAQGCCGALELHAGRLDALRGRAVALTAVFPAGLDWIVSNAAGCGSTMREYHHWVTDPAVERLAQRTRDVSELLVDADLPLARLERTVAYHDACHLSHGQRVRAAPRALLRRIPGLTLVELQGGEVCCGSAGVYNILEPAMADELLALKIDRIVESGARTLVAGNPGCLMQIARGCRARGLDIEVLHPVTLLAQAAGLQP
ncbi:MAG TPA: (Fe-S)-binding protein [Candidatus Limnocylindria bacterium]|nr:(Fe-S)-binding protein [Candidatus Limnocylindria bacterium]